MKLSFLFFMGIIVAVWTLIAIIVVMLCDDGKVSARAARISVVLLIVGIVGCALILVLMVIYALCAFGW